MVWRGKAIRQEWRGRLSNGTKKRAEPVGGSARPKCWWRDAAAFAVMNRRALAFRRGAGICPEKADTFWRTGG